MPAKVKLREDALAIFDAAIMAANAKHAVVRHLIRINPPMGERAGRIFLVAAGKAAAQMAEAVEEVLGERIERGVVVTKHGHAGDYAGRCEVIEAGHPIPDEAGRQGAQRVLSLLDDLTAKDLVMVAVSGGASALLSAPVDGISLAAKQQTTDLLLRAGADINQLNCVRKHLSQLKGGWLAAHAYPAAVLGLLLSDVVGDPLDVIGSGLTAPDRSTFSQALQILDQLGVAGSVPAEVRDHLERGVRGEIAETPKPGDGLFENVRNVVVGSSRQALEAAAQKARLLGYRPLILSSRVEGEAREAARLHAGILWEAITSGHPQRPPTCILTGGETTVTVRGSGKGGRNQEFALAAALHLCGANNVTMLCGGTDGTDGPTDAAGALVTGSTAARAEEMGLDPADYLDRNDSYTFFEALGDLVKTGPTGTNVMDVNIMLAG